MRPTWTSRLDLRKIVLTLVMLLTVGGALSLAGCGAEFEPRRSIT